MKLLTKKTFFLFLLRPFFLLSDIILNYSTLSLFEHDSALPFVQIKLQDLDKKGAKEFMDGIQETLQVEPRTLNVLCWQ